MMPSCRLA